MTTSSGAARAALLACVLLALALPTARAQTPTPLWLDVLLTDALEANPSLQAARLDALARAHVGEQVGTLPDPMVSATLFAIPMQMAEGGEQRAQWSVTQELPWPGTLSLRRRAADLSVQMATYEADALALDLAYEVRRAYYDLYRLQALETLLDAFEERLALFTEALTVRYEVGRGPQGAVLQVHLERERLREERVALQVRQQAARQVLARLTDRPARVFSDTLALIMPPLPEVDAAHADSALRQRPEVQALNAAARQADAEEALARKAFYPDLGVGLMYMDVAHGDGHGPDPLAVMVSARIPLQRGRLRARLEQARLLKAGVSARQQALETVLATEAAETRYAARREAETLSLYRDRLLPQAQATVESLLAAYTTGQTDYAALLDAERLRYGVLRGLEDTRYRYLDALARLDRALGTPVLATLPAPPTSPLSDAPLR